MSTLSELPSASVSQLPSVPEATGGLGGAVKEKNDNWRFVEPQPVREDQVENAVKFLSHPKVKGSPMIYRRSFLEKKGLSREEIDEAFRRVPDPPSDASATTIPSPPPGAVNPPHHTGQVVGPAMQPVNRQVVAKSASWTQMLLALGVFAAAGAGAGVVTKRFFIPKFREWILEIVSGRSTHTESEKSSKPNPVEEATKAAAAAAVAAATAAKQVAGAMQEIANSKSEDRQRLDSIIRAMEAQTQELKNTLAGMKDAVQSAEVTKYQRSVTNSFHSNGVSTSDYLKGQTSGDVPNSSSESRIVNSKTLNFGLAPDLNNGPYTNGQVNGSPSSTVVPVHAPHSQSYLDVMAMLERGEKPPGIREVNDKPPNPNQAPSNPQLQPRPKPWERPAVEAPSTSPGANDQAGPPGWYSDRWSVRNDSSVESPVRTELTIGSTAAGSSEPWWRRKVDVGTGFNPTSVKITEVDTVTETDIATVQPAQPAQSSTSWQSGGRTGWMPPAVPLPVYPGAEEAIKRPKPPVTSQTPSSSEPGSASPGSSSLSQKDGNTVQVFEESLDNSTHPSFQSEQRAEAPEEQELIYGETSLGDSTLFKDVVQEDGGRQSTGETR